MKHAAFLLVFLALPIQGQVVDVDGDDVVGAHEVIAVADQWKGPASASNEHQHLGQTWTGDRNPLVIRGNFPDRPIIIGPIKEKVVGRLRAPLILENTATQGHGLIVESGNVAATLSGSNSAPDLVLGGLNAILAATEESSSDLFIRANDGIHFIFEYDGLEGNTFAIGTSAGLAASFRANGDLLLLGEVLKSGSKTRIDHPQDPANKYLTHSSVESPDMKNVYDGVVALDENGEAVVQLPDYFEAFNRDFRYQLTCIGGFAPVYVAEKIKEDRFKIAGGNPNQEISWMVTGVRQDAYAKANPIQVEEEKSDGEKGKYLQPELFGEPVEKSVGLLSPE